MLDSFRVRKLFYNPFQSDVAATVASLRALLMSFPLGISNAPDQQTAKSICFSRGLQAVDDQLINDDHQQHLVALNS